MSIDKKLLYELAEQAPSTEELEVLTNSNVEKWISDLNVRSGKKCVPNEVVYLSYYNWCCEKNETALSYIPFFKALNKIHPGKQARRKFDPSSFDMSPEYYFKARQKLLTSLPNVHANLPGRIRPKGIYGKKKSTKDKTKSE